MEKAENEVTPNEARQQAAQGAVQDRASVPDTASLREYARAKLAIASRVRVLRDICRRQGSAAGERQCADLQVKLAEDRFTLAVLGLFKRGKSSLMNAILGRQALPTGVLPLTSTITVLRFGPVERLLVHRQGWALTQEAPLSDLATYVTEKGNPGNRMQVTTACLELPVPFLRRGVEFVDTPGVGSAIQANTATTYGFLPACDAALFVTSVDAPLTAAELEFLQRIRQYVHKVFFVVNKTDLLDDAERDEVLAFTRGAIARQVGDDAVTLHPLSARLGLAARLAGDTQAYARSGVAALEEALAAFLADERAATFLEAVTDKAERLLAEEQDALELRLRSRQLSESARAERAAALHQSLQSHRAERQNLVREARGSAQSAARAALETEMAAYLREAASALAVDAERLLRRYPWWPAGAAMARLRRHCRRRMSADGWQWVLGRTDMLSAAAQAALDSRREALAAAIARIPSIAASVMGLGDRHTPAPADLADWRAVVHLPHQALDDLPVNAAAPAWFWCLPARVARGTLVRTLREALAGFSGACLRRAAEAAAVAVDSTTARAAEAVEEQALAAERSALASLNAGPAGAEEDAAVGRALEELRSRFAELPGAERPAPAGASGAQAPKRAARPAPVSDGVRRPPEGAPVRPGTGAQVGAPGCPVCRTMSKAAYDYYCRFQYELASSESVQTGFRDDLGLCPLHSWQLMAISSPHGASLGLVSLAERVAHELATLPPSTASSKGVQDLVPGRRCRVCAMLRETERRCVRELAELLDKDERRLAYLRSQGLCLRHLGRVVAAVRDETAGVLLAHASRRLAEWAEDMQTYVLKREAIRRGLLNQDEEQAYLRALVHLVGERNVQAPWDMDGEI